MRQTLEALSPYSVKSNEGYILLDNNESFINLLSKIPLQTLQNTVEINRYPADAVNRLTQAYGVYLGIPNKNILAGNGSDEWISLICQFALDPGDRVIVVEPDFSMYEKNAQIMGATVCRVGLNNDFSLPIERLTGVIKETQPKCLFLSNPNNPTGLFYSTQEIDILADAMKDVNGYFILDEAYIEFAGMSYVEQALKENHIIILRTASKALGMAGLRLGFFITNDQLITDISRIKPPYNVNQLSAYMGTFLLSKPELIQESLLQQKEQKKQLASILNDFAENTPRVIVIPSETNFFLIEMEKSKELFEFLYAKKIKIRYFGQGRLKNAIRISSGTKEEMTILRKTLKEWGKSDETGRKISKNQ